MEQQRFRNRNTTVTYHLRTNQESRYAMKWYYEKKEKIPYLGDTYERNGQTWMKVNV